jgi:hypothetical protein
MLSVAAEQGQITANVLPYAWTDVGRLHQSDANRMNCTDYIVPLQCECIGSETSLLSSLFLAMTSTIYSRG